jgi:repressor LexA
MYQLKLPPEQLTPRQLQILKAVADSRLSRCYSPTIAELARRLGISRSTTFEHIEELRRKELLAHCPTRARSLKLTARAQRLLKQIPAPETEYDESQGPEGIPLLGKVAAGLPIEAIENAEQFTFSAVFSSSDEIFALQVAGNSMIDDDIRDGDYVICRRTPTAQNGRLVVAALEDDSVTLKRFYKEKIRVRLQPANDDYDPIYSDNCRIEAVVVGLVRKL